MPSTLSLVSSHRWYRPLWFGKQYSNLFMLDHMLSTQLWDLASPTTEPLVVVQKLNYYFFVWLFEGPPFLFSYFERDTRAFQSGTSEKWSSFFFLFLKCWCALFYQKSDQTKVQRCKECIDMLVFQKQTKTDNKTLRSFLFFSTSSQVCFCFFIIIIIIINEQVLRSHKTNKGCSIGVLQAEPQDQQGL